MSHAAAPQTLAETGRYSESVERFSPQYPLWTDGAAKDRFIYLPPGARIDATDPDVFSFPVGTKLWKEFRFKAQLIETRFFQRTGSGWDFATYASNGARAPAAGIPRAYEIEPGIWHAIPSEADCHSCHDSDAPVLGFSALQLSDDRDPNAEPLRGDELTLGALLRSSRISGVSAEVKIAADDPQARSALGYLHGNCGGCHNLRGALAVVGMDLSQTIDGTNVQLPSVIGARSRFVLPGEAGSLRTDAIVFRMSSTHALSRMPPLGTQLVDAAAVERVRKFLTQSVQSTHARSNP